MLLTAKLMLDWLKETDMATCLESAVARVIAEGKVRTYDMSGQSLPAAAGGDTDSPWRGWQGFNARRRQSDRRLRHLNCDFVNVAALQLGEELLAAQ